MVVQNSFPKTSHKYHVRNFFGDNSDYLTGLVITLLSATAFLLAVYVKPEWQKSVWGITYSAVWLYAAILLSKKKMRFFWKKQPPEFFSERLLWWQLWLISCFALNKTMPIFHDSVLWVDMLLVFNFVAVVLYHFKSHVGNSGRVYIYLTIPISALLMLYFSVYLIPYYLVAIPGILLIGISLHAFVPLFLFVYKMNILAKGLEEYRSEILFGLLVPTLFVTFFIFRTYQEKTKLEDIYQQQALNNSSTLPGWVRAAQQVEHNWVSERLLLSGDIYQTKGEVSFFGIDRVTRNTSEQPRHDPLVFMASLFLSPLEIPSTDRVKILESGLNYRKFQGERFWRGDDLRTGIVKSNIRIYPGHRMAYTEKTLTIHNDAKWGNQEAIYTFYVPEGSVATSLSLWVNGKEETGYLTTKSKSDSAYNQVVNVESRAVARDPSVVNWLEGNRLMVRVFPCPAGETREVKIGITSPLIYKNKRLIYRNSPFAGPTSSAAKEYMNLSFNTPAKGISAPTGWSEGQILTQSYTAHWEVSFDAPELSNEAFVFNGKSYQTKPLKTVSEIFKPKAIYLDINQSWKRSEMEDILEQNKGIPIYAFDGIIREITEENSDVVFENLTAYNFSLFPVYEIKHSGDIFFVTKSTPTGPFLNSLGESDFAKLMKQHTKNFDKVRVVSLNGELPNHLKMWEEVGKVERVGNNLDELLSLLDKESFETSVKAQNEVNLTMAGVRITESKASNTATESSAPDHLKRLFDYNLLMQEYGSNYLTTNNADEHLIEAAQEANIVTPVSSLIVLETQADYKRFGISKSQNTLDNATLKKSGSVPEPHEWMLIIAFAMAVLWLYFRKI